MIVLPSVPTKHHKKTTDAVGTLKYVKLCPRPRLFGGKLYRQLRLRKAKTNTDTDQQREKEQDD